MTGSSLVETTSASESATYDAINRLEERGLIESNSGPTWSLTGAGRLAADLIERCDRVDDVIESNLEYWKTHDPSGIPDRFRHELDRLTGCRVIEAPDTDPYRAARRAKRTIEDASEELAVTAPIYDERRAEAFLGSDADRRRIVMTPAVLERLLRDDPEQPDGPVDDIEIRVRETDVAMIVTESELVFSVPTCEGGFDAGTEVIVETEDAIEWGRRLFDSYWSDAPTVESFVADRWPELVPEINR